MNLFVTCLCAVLCSAQALTVNPLSRGYVVFGERLSHVDARVLPFCKQYKCGPASVQQGLDKLSGEPTVTTYVFPLTIQSLKDAQLSLTVDSKTRELRILGLHFLLSNKSNLNTYRTLIYRWADTAKLPRTALAPCFKADLQRDAVLEMKSQSKLGGDCSFGTFPTDPSVPKGYIGIDLEVAQN